MFPPKHKVMSVDMDVEEKKKEKEKEKEKVPLNNLGAKF